MKSFIRRLIFLLSLLYLAKRAVAANAIAPDTEIERILRDRVEVATQTVAIVVGVVDEEGQRVVAYGKPSRGSNHTVDGDTVFEIGSATKVFTALLLADAVERGEVKLDDPISRYLPAAVKVPSRNGRQITLLDLATHTSGLPRLPDNLVPADADSPYAGYTVEQMYAFLSGYTLPRDIGAKYEYSNLGAGLLGHLLALKAGTNYEALVLQRICLPLGMANTCIAVSPELRSRLATGYNKTGRPVPPFDMPALPGAGALRSTAHDLLKFVAANLGQTQSPLWPAMQLAQAPRHATGLADGQVGLCWQILDKFGTQIIWHNGETMGFHSFIGLDRANRRGVVVLANTARSIDDIGLHLLESRHALARFEPERERVVIQLEPKVLDRYVGRYEFEGAPGVFYNVRRNGSKLMAQITGQGYLQIFAESPTNFFYKAVNAQITFNVDATGNVQSLVVHQNGLDRTWKRISAEPPKERQAIKLDPRLYDAYVGEYQLMPGKVFTLRREGDRLMVCFTGQSFLEIFPESPTRPLMPKSLSSKTTRAGSLTSSSIKTART